MGQAYSRSRPAEAPEPPPGYYDILLVGKTGKGKSTTGNKLLCVSNVTHACGTRFHLWKSTVEPPPEEASEDEEQPFFPEAKDNQIESTTSRCKLLSNEATKMRVLDTPGFADSRENANLYQANLQGMRWIVRRQQEHELAFSRILYFLPERGPLEKADRALQEEIKVMVHFFADSIFYNMVIIATVPPRRSKRASRKVFDKADAQQTEKVFFRAMEVVMREEGLDIHDPEVELKCPPIVYISLKDTPTQVLEKVKSARVQGKAPPTIQPQEDPSPPQASASYNGVPSAASITPTRLVFRHDVCAKCAVRVVTRENGEKMVRGGEGPGDNTPYNMSRCHPAMYHKYSSAKKVFGGMAHIATFGLGILIGDVITKKGSWPGFTNSDEVCPKCGGPPGTPGCATVLQDCAVQLKGGHGTVNYVCNHTNNIVEE